MAPPVLLLMKGHPGSGKTTIARALAQQLRWPLIDKDDARDCLQAYAVQQRKHPVTPAEQSSSGPHEAARLATATGGADGAASTSSLTPDANQLAYEIMFQIAGTQLSLGLSVIVDSPLARPELYHRAVELAERHKAQVAVVECFCSDLAAWRQRLERRGREEEGGAKGHKPTSWQQLQDLLDKYRGCWRWSVDGSVVLPCHISVDTCGPPDAASADLPAPDEGSPPSPQAFVGSILEQLQLAGVAGSVRFSDGRQPAESLRRRTLA